MKIRSLRIMTACLLTVFAAGIASVASAGWTVPALELTATPSVTAPVVVTPSITPTDIWQPSVTPTMPPQTDNFQPTLTPSPPRRVLLPGVNEGNLSGQRAIYDLTAERGQAFVIYMSAATFDPVIEVLDAQDVQVAYDDDSGEGNLPFLLFVAPDSSVYRVVVDAYGGFPNGSYVMHNTTAMEPLAYGDTQTVMFDGTKNYVYAFEAEAGDVITLRAHSDGLVDTTLQLFSPDGTVLAYIDDTFGLDPAFMYQSIGQTGRHYVLHAPYGPSSTGEVKLSLEKPEIRDLAKDPVADKEITGTYRDIFMLPVREGLLYSITFVTDGASSGSVYISNSMNTTIASVDFENTRDVVLTFRADSTDNVKVDFTAHPNQRNRHISVSASVAESE